MLGQKHREPVDGVNGYEIYSDGEGGDDGVKGYEIYSDGEGGDDGVKGYEIYSDGEGGDDGVKGYEIYSDGEGGDDGMISDSTAFYDSFPLPGRLTGIFYTKYFFANLNFLKIMRQSVENYFNSISLNSLLPTFIYLHFKIIIYSYSFFSSCILFSEYLTK